MPILSPPQPNLRPASQADHEALTGLLDSARFKHEHLDWIHALDLLGSSPFVISISGDTIHGCLACPPDRPGVAWLKLFACASNAPLGRTWENLWSAAQASLHEHGVRQAMVLPVADWLRTLLERSGFRKDGQVVFLEHFGPPPRRVDRTGLTLQPMSPADLSAVALVDAAAFTPLWQLSPGMLEKAFAQASSATVAIVDQLVVGYQLSTLSPWGAHLARLAVEPSHQGSGVGRALVTEALLELHGQGTPAVTVNTQSDNRVSLRLYAEQGFMRTGQDYPIYRIRLS